jgi:hypothetical protein
MKRNAYYLIGMTVHPYLTLNYYIDHNAGESITYAERVTRGKKFYSLDDAVKTIEELKKHPINVQIDFTIIRKN